MDEAERVVLRKTLKRMPGITRNLTPENAPQRWFTMVATTVDENVKDLLDYTIEQLKTGNVFSIINGIGSISSLYVLSIPYYIAYKSFQDTRQFAEQLSVAESPARRPKVAHLSCVMPRCPRISEKLYFSDTTSTLPTSFRRSMRPLLSMVAQPTVS